MPSFTTTFTPPSAPSGFTVDADLDASAVRLAWDASAIAEVDFDGFRLYRSADGGITWSLIAVMAGVDDTSYDDYEAPLNVFLSYRLTQSNVDFESDPAEATIELDSTAWQVVVPGDAGLTFSVTHMKSARLTSPKVQDVFSPMGRPGKLVVGDVVQVEDGELSFQVMPDNLAMVALVKAVQARMTGGIIVKATDGTVWQAQLGDVTREFTNVGVQQLSIPLIGVG